MVLEPEPELVTDPTLMEVLDELRAMEPLFHRRELGTARSHFEAMTTDDFWEVGASGRAYSREYVLEILEERTSAQTRMSGRPAISTAAGSVLMCTC